MLFSLFPSYPPLSLFAPCVLHNNRYMAQGLEHDDFTAAFESLTSVVAAYQSLAAQKA